VNLDLSRRVLAEAVGTAMLLMAIVGSGIASERLSPDDAGVQLLASAAVTAGALVAIILAFGSLSGAHINPAVSLTARLMGRMSNRETTAYIGAQLAGASGGTILANLMFELPVVDIASTDRSGGGLLLAEVIATTGLLLIIFGTTRSAQPHSVAYAVGAYIGAAYFFTASTSFANPAVTVARMLSDTFAGIAPTAVPTFLAAQVAGVAMGYWLIRGLFVTRHPATPCRDGSGYSGERSVAHFSDQNVSRRHGQGDRVP
jgi:glycerol uptake facilitator-like aquaporin